MRILPRRACQLGGGWCIKATNRELRVKICENACPAAHVVIGEPGEEGHVCEMLNGGVGVHDGAARDHPYRHLTGQSNNIVRWRGG